MPRFSIILPTHNRAKLLQYALASALGQDFRDVEIRVSDDQSTDDTAAVVRRLGGDRVRHLRTPRRMSMADHFEWAISQASGEFITLLCDDDALVPHALTRVDAAARDTGTRVVALQTCVYYHPDWHEIAERNSVAVGRYSGRTIRCDSRAVLREILRRFKMGGTPRSNNSFCHRDVVADVRRRAGRFFLTPAPDASSCCLTLASVPDYSLIDEPLQLFGSSPESIGTDQSTRRSGPSESFRKGVGGVQLFELSPIGVYCVTNIVTESYLRARRALGEGAGFPPVDWLEFYRQCRADLARLEANGVSIEADLLELAAFLQSLPATTRMRLGVVTARDRLARSALGGPFRRLKHLVAPPPIRVDHSAGTLLRGSDHGFANILECANKLPALCRLHGAASAGYVMKPEEAGP